MRFASAKKALKSGICSELSIAIAASKESDGRSFCIQSPRRNCGFELPELRSIANFVLRRGNCHTSNLRAAACEETCGGTITATDVANLRAGADLCVFRDQLGQLQDRLLARFIAAQPEAVMDVLAPDIAIEMIQLIVMQRDRVAADLARAMKSRLQRSGCVDNVLRVDPSSFIT